ncbi:probable ubiquilin [Cyanidioschyzon merolae strain 10D]|jgi:ubiquilin|uniref:Probable ubiquilin n=1 Tax=Cyanidioschyzon merolae (strain NIES-3377 / 10D) TaxID=280699 RepID=M1VF08_CYAM1|nr:probable ubiquilin [Cyanidioschyzon merolae strain 10D]BAM79113.1 probable ubiquilin [Cyanidioschyzon merolae strain 10D]|eukprot:XP_005535399.1 probable ubiquilin [Cyanidioschyzon merolae strain 10D]
MEGEPPRTTSENEMTTSNEAEESAFELHFKSSTGSKFTLPVQDLEEKIEALKQRLAEPSGFAPETMRVIYKGRVLKDAETLRELQEKYGLESGHTMHLVRGVRPAAAPAGAPTGSALPGVGGPVPATPASAASSAPSLGSSAGSAGNLAGSTPTPSSAGFDMFGQARAATWNGTAANASAATGAPLGYAPDAASTGANVGSAGAGGGSSSMQRLQQQMQQALLANPNAMQEILSSPLMESMAENPELMRALMMANPQIREMINQNPEIGHVLNDPGVLRQTLQLMRNPHLMQEMMRTSDRAMANIESMPGGFDALRRLYTDIQGPLESSGPMAPGAGASTFTRATPSNPTSSDTGNGRSSTTLPLPPSWAAGATPATTGNNGSQMPWSSPDLSEEAAVRATRAILDNPELFRLTQEQFIASDTFLLANPMVSAMAAMNPQMMQALQDVQFRRNLFTREFFESTLAMQEAQLRFRRAIHQALLQSGYDPAIATTPQPMASATAGGPRQTRGATFTDPTAQMTREQLEQHFATQLQQMREMGFFDTDACIAALRATGGNVAAALDRLLNGS